METAGHDPKRASHGVPTAGAVANAIAKVVGARVHKLPMTPERVWEAQR